MANIAPTRPLPANIIADRLYLLAALAVNAVHPPTRSQAANQFRVEVRPAVLLAILSVTSAPLSAASVNEVEARCLDLIFRRWRVQPPTSAAEVQWHLQTAVVQELLGRLEYANSPARRPMTVLQQIDGFEQESLMVAARAQLTSPQIYNVMLDHALGSMFTDAASDHRIFEVTLLDLLVRHRTAMAIHIIASPNGLLLSALLA